METVHGNYSIKLLFVEQILICLWISLFFFFFVLLWNFSSLGVRDSLDMFLVNRGFEFVNYLQYHFQCGLRQLTNFFNFIFSSKVGWVIRLCFLLYLFFVFLIFCGRHWKSIFLFGGTIFYLPSCCPVNEVLSRVSTASHCRFKSSKMELTENKTNIWVLVEAWPTKIHDHICHIFKAKIKRLVSRKLSVMNLWISLHSGDKIFKEKKL